MGLNGIPQAFAPNNLAQEVANQRRRLEQLTSARARITLGSVVEGGTIDDRVGDQLTGAVQEKLVVESKNIGPGALDGQTINDAVIHTAPAPDGSWVTIDREGVRGYGPDGAVYMDAAKDLVHLRQRVDTDLPQQIDDAAAAPITDARLPTDGSLTRWPFAAGTVPSGALEHGAVGAEDLADFSVMARKLKTNQHIIY